MQLITVSTRKLAQFILLASLAAAGGPGLADENENPAHFSEYIQSLWPAAQAEGVTRFTFDSAFKDVHLDHEITANTDRQAEFVKPIWVYLSSAVSAIRIHSGKLRFADVRNWLVKARNVFGADSAVVMGIWGLETDFGSFSGNIYVINALANLAFIHYRGDYFRDELLAALKILQAGDINPRSMRGSWAGAMGQPQFMPSSYLDYAVDFDGHGRRDIWSDAPDAIGSIANYFEKHGWLRDLPWGCEVTLPRNFHLSSSDFLPAASFQSFVRRGVKTGAGHVIPPNTPVRLLMPTGLKGPVFLVTSNFDVIKAYNNSTSYALGVALLGDAILGRSFLQAKWPVNDHFFNADEVRELQSLLKKKAMDVGSIDGVPGAKLEVAVRAYQASVGLSPDGYPTLSLLRALKESH